ncbi:TonB-dependent receptor [Flavisolibacter sp. BT320]|nr:TonB-dependent receptor [Flavisolibacter longurius]
MMPTLTKRLLLIFLAIVMAKAGIAQPTNLVVKGSLYDSTALAPIQNATVSISSQKDTSLRFFLLSSSTGSFAFNLPDTGTYRLHVSFQKADLLKKAFYVAHGSTITELGILYVKRNEHVLPEVVIKDISPLSLRGDTIHYKAGAYKTSPDASVEDLLKKLPGVQVDRSGTVKAQGETVQKVYVDGKEFFGNDPSMATKNLTADMIEQVQVFSDASDQAKFSGIDDGSRSRAINLKLKKDKKKGHFGNASAGIGTRSRYQAGFSANLFDGASQLSLLGGTSNTVASASAMAGQTSAIGNNQILPGRTGTGLNESSVAGFNYHNLFGKNLDVTTSYLLLHERTINERSAYRRTFLPDSVLLTERTSNVRTRSLAHRFNMKVTYTIDSFNTLVFTPSLRLQKSRSSYGEQQANAVQTSAATHKAGESQSSSANNAQPLNLVNSLIWRRRFSSPGRTFSAALTQIINRNDMAVYSDIASKVLHSNGSLSRSFDRNYYSENILANTHHTVALSYTEPVGKGKILEVHYGFGRQHNASNRKAYAYDSVTKTYGVPEDSLTNDFTQANRWHRFGANFRGMTRKLNYQIGVTVQQLLFRINDDSKNSQLSHRFRNLLPVASVSYQFRSGKSLQLQYRGRSNQPDIRQLQDVTDILSYPYIQKGNPALKQEYSHVANLSYNAFNSTNFRSFFVYIAYTKIQNKITSSIQQNAFEQIWMPVNLNGAYNLSGNVGIGIPFASWEGATLNTSSQIDLYRNVSLVNNTRNFSKELNLSQDLQFHYNPGGNFDMGLTLNASYNTLSYTLENTQNTSYFSHGVALNASCFLGNGFRIASTVDYTAYTGRAEGFNQDYLLWNAAISKPILRNKKAEIRFTVYDILNRNTSLTRYQSENFIEDSRNLTLKRFGMLMLIYRLNKVGPK